MKRCSCKKAYIFLSLICSSFILNSSFVTAMDSEENFNSETCSFQRTPALSPQKEVTSLQASSLKDFEEEQSLIISSKKKSDQKDQEKLVSYISKLHQHNIEVESTFIPDEKKVRLVFGPTSWLWTVFNDYTPVFNYFPRMQTFSIALEMPHKDLSLGELKSAVNLARNNSHLIQLISKHSEFGVFREERDQLQILLGALTLRNALIKGKTKTFTYNFLFNTNSEVEDAISEGLQKGDSLETFNVCINRELGKKIIESIKENKSIKSANFSFYYRILTSDEVDNLSYFIVNSPSLKSLDLAVSLDASLLMSLANASRHESLSLEKLTLDLAKNAGSEQRVMEKATASFFEALQVNKSLRVLCFGFSLSLDNTKILAEAFKFNTKLKILAVPGKGIGDEGVTYLAEGLRENTSMTEINISGNGISDNGADALLDLLNVNSTLTTLHLGRNTMSNSKKAKINQVLRERRTPIS